MIHYISELLEQEPAQYGLRGDRAFWNYLKTYFADKEVSYGKEQMVEDIYRLFQELSGESLTIEARPLVESLAQGGMSSGRLSGEFWVNVGIPLLLERYAICDNKMKEGRV